MQLKFRVFGEVFALHSEVEHAFFMCVRHLISLYSVKATYLWLCTKSKVYQLQIMFLINQQIFLVKEKVERNASIT